MPSSFSLLATVPDTHANAFQGCPETVESGNVFSSVTLFRKHPSALSQLLSSNGHHGTQEAMPLILLPHAAVVAVSQLSVAQLWSHTVCVAPQAAAWQFWLSRRPGTNGNFLGSSQVRNIDLGLGPCDADQRDTSSVLPLLYHEAMTKPVLGPPYPHLIPNHSCVHTCIRRGRQRCESAPAAAQCLFTLSTRQIPPTSAAVGRVSRTSRVRLASH